MKVWRGDHNFTRRFPQTKIMSSQNYRMSLRPAQPFHHKRQPLARPLSLGAPPPLFRSELALEVSVWKSFGGIARIAVAATRNGSADRGFLGEGITASTGHQGFLPGVCPLLKWMFESQARSE
jgi:hypothetical protein